MEINTAFIPQINDTIMYMVPGNIRRFKFIYKMCPICSVSRWVYAHDKTDGTCRICAATRNLPTGHGRIAKFLVGGYYVVYLSKDSPYVSMAWKSGYISEHRLVMAQKIGRLLTKDDIVHHRDGVRTNNTLNNLVLVTRHNHYTVGCTDVIKLLKIISVLELENDYLRNKIT